MSFSSGFPSLTLKRGAWTEDQGQTDGASRSLGSLACWMSKETPEARRRVGGGSTASLFPLTPGQPDEDAAKVRGRAPPTRKEGALPSD